MITSALFAFLLPALVSAHGYIAQVIIDGTVYPGNSVGTTPTIKSVIRQINSNDPVKGASNPYLNCGQSAALAAEVATANPGSTIQVKWVGGTSGDSPWFHNVGPVLHYMAMCDGSCATYNSSSAEWFKISELGLKPDGTTWYQADLAKAPVSVTIPKTLASGNYLLRSEIIALQLGMTEGGAEFYPGCIQLAVGGSQTGKPTSSEEVTFPGGYADTDAGILTPNIYNPPILYTFPGPLIAAFVSSDSGNSTGSGPSGNTTSSSPAASPSSSLYPSSPSPTVSSSSSLSPSSSPSHIGIYVPPSATPTPSPSPTSGSGSCMSKRSRGTDKRMHRRRYRTSH